MQNRHKAILITFVLVWICFTALVIAQLTYVSPPSERRFSGINTSYPIYGTVDQSLSNYVNITAGVSMGASGPGYDWNTAVGEVSWIGASQDNVRDLQNLHLTVYTRMDSNTTTGTRTLIQVGIHVMVNLTATPIPPDAIDHQEIIIPKLGPDTATFGYEFNCTTYIH